MDQEKTEQQEQQDLLQIIAAQRDAALNSSAVLQVKFNTVLRELEELKEKRAKKSS